MSELPDHVLQQIEEDQQRQEEKKRQEEYDRSLCKVGRTVLCLSLSLISLSLSLF